MKRIYKRIFYVAHVIIKNVKSLNFTDFRLCMIK